MDSMFGEIYPATDRFCDRRAVAASVLAHLGLLAAILFHRPPVIELAPAWLANGSGTQSYRVVYAPPDGQDAPADDKMALAHSAAAPHRRPKASSPKPAPDHLQVPADAEASDRNARAGSALGTMIDGPIEGHEVHVAYPVVFPDPPVARSEVPRDLQGDVIVEVTIDSQGNVVETRILQAIGHGIDEKIVAALRQWRYQPATLDGVPVASKHDVHFHFPS
ncbi:MAG: energy transducer TonB [Terriglobales bacterium]